MAIAQAERVAITWPAREQPVDESLPARGASKSNASRALIDNTAEKLAAFVSRKLDGVDLVAMFIDGIEFAGHSVVIALGVTIDGKKTPLGIWAGSTENTVVATALLQNLIERGLRVEESMLFVIDGGRRSARRCATCSVTARSCNAARFTRRATSRVT